MMEKVLGNDAKFKRLAESNAKGRNKGRSEISEKTKGTEARIVHPGPSPADLFV